MIEFLSSWTKSIGIAIVIVSILEMLLPNNKTKKYISMVLGIFIIFNIVAPLVKNKEKLDLSSFNTDMETSVNVNQASMDERINELYEDELKKDIKEKLTQKGYKIRSVVVKTKRTDEEWEIKKIYVSVENANKKDIKEFLIKEYGVKEECLKIS